MLPLTRAVQAGWGIVNPSLVPESGTEKSADPPFGDPVQHIRAGADVGHGSTEHDPLGGRSTQAPKAYNKYSGSGTGLSPKMGKSVERPYGADALQATSVPADQL